MRLDRWCAFVLVVMLAIPAAAQLSLSTSSASGTNCQNILVGHHYAFVFQGYVDLGFSALTPNAGGGAITFYTNGTYSGWSSLSIGGIILPNPMHGTYTMEATATKPATCTGSAVGDDGSEFQLVVSSNGRELEQMHTDAGLVVVIDSALMENGPCSNATLRGNYVYVANGLFAPPGFPDAMGKYAPFAFSGVIHFDGRGNVDGWDTVSLMGNPTPRTYSGWYEVRTGCSAVMELHDTLKNDIHTRMFVYEHAQKIAIVNTDAGLVLAFNASRQ